MTDPTITIGVDGTSLPLKEVVTGRAFVTGKSGAGKSNSSGVVVEGVLDQGRATLIVDVEGEYKGLKERYDVLHATVDGTGEATHIGPEHADRLADLALIENIPVVLDLSAALPEEAAEIVDAVATKLFEKEHTERKPFLLVVEEIHEFLPEQGSRGDVGDTLLRITKRGRKRGLGILGVSQRPANVSKDFVTQCDWLSWHRLTYDNDTSVVKRHYGSEIANQVSDLDKGEAFLVTDWDDKIRRVQWVRKKTHDFGKTPDLEDEETPELRSIDSSIIDELSEAGDAVKSREEQIDELQDRLDEREGEIEALEDRITDLKDMRDMVASTQGIGSDETITVDFEGASFEVPDAIEAEVLEIVDSKRDLEDENAALREQIEELESEVSELQEYREIAEKSGDRDQLLDDLQELIFDRYPGLFDVDRDEKIRELRDRLDEKDAEIERIKKGREIPTEPEGFDDIVEKLKTDGVRAAVEDARDGLTSISTTEDNIFRTLVALARAPSQPVHAEDILGSVPYETTTTVNRIFASLADVGILKVSKDGRRKVYSIDQDGLDRAIARYTRDEQVDEIATEITGGKS